MSANFTERISHLASVNESTRSNNNSMLTLRRQALQEALQPSIKNEAQLSNKNSIYMQPFQSPYLFGDVTRQVDEPRFSSQLSKRMSDLRQQEFQNQQVVVHAQRKFAEFGKKLNLLQRMVYAKPKNGVYQEKLQELRKAKLIEKRRRLRRLQDQGDNNFSNDLRRQILEESDELTELGDHGNKDKMKMKRMELSIDFDTIDFKIAVKSEADYFDNKLFKELKKQTSKEEHISQQVSVHSPVPGDSYSTPGRDSLLKSNIKHTRLDSLRSAISGQKGPTMTEAEKTELLQNARSINEYKHEFWREEKMKESGMSPERLTVEEMKKGMHGKLRLGHLQLKEVFHRQMINNHKKQTTLAHRTRAERQIARQALKEMSDTQFNGLMSKVMPPVDSQSKLDSFRTDRQSLIQGRAPGTSSVEKLPELPLAKLDASDRSRNNTVLGHGKKNVTSTQRNVSRFAVYEFDKRSQSTLQLRKKDHTSSNSNTSRGPSEGKQHANILQKQMSAASRLPTKSPVINIKKKQFSQSKSQAGLPLVNTTSKQLKKVQLEAVISDPYLSLPYADIDTATDGLVSGRSRESEQQFSNAIGEVDSNERSIFEIESEMQRILQREFDDPNDKKLKAIRKQFTAQKYNSQICHFHELNPSYDGVAQFQVGPDGKGVNSLLEYTNSFFNKNQSAKKSKNVRTRRNLYVKQMEKIKEQMLEKEAGQDSGEDVLLFEGESQKDADKELLSKTALKAATENMMSKIGLGMKKMVSQQQEDPNQLDNQISQLFKRVNDNAKSGNWRPAKVADLFDKDLAYRSASPTKVAATLAGEQERQLKEQQAKQIKAGLNKEGMGTINGIRLENEHFYIELKGADPDKLFNKMQQDLKILSQIISYNPYDRAQADWYSDEKRIERSQKFEMFLLKYAKPKEKAYSSASGSSDESDESLSQVDELETAENDTFDDTQNYEAIESKKFKVHHVAPTDASCQVCSHSSPYKQRWRELGMLKESTKASSARREMNPKQKTREKLLSKASAYLRQTVKPQSLRNSKKIATQQQPSMPKLSGKDSIDSRSSQTSRNKVTYISTTGPAMNIDENGISGEQTPKGPRLTNRLTKKKDNKKLKRGSDSDSIYETKSEKSATSEPDPRKLPIKPLDQYVDLPDAEVSSDADESMLHSDFEDHDIEPTFSSIDTNGGAHPIIEKSEKKFLRELQQEFSDNWFEEKLAQREHERKIRAAKQGKKISEEAGMINAPQKESLGSGNESSASKSFDEESLDDVKVPVNRNLGANLTENSRIQLQTQREQKELQRVQEMRGQYESSKKWIKQTAKIRSAARAVKIAEFNGKPLADHTQKFMVDTLTKGNSLPKSYGFINKEGSTDKAINLSDVRIPNDYLEAFAQSIKINRSLQEIHMRNTELSNEGGIIILNALPIRQITALSFPKNKRLRGPFYTKLQDLLEKSSQFKLQQLDLESNHIKDSTCIELCERLTQITSLRYLNLNGNELSDKSALAIGGVCACCNLQELHLQYNRFNAKGGNVLAQHIESSRTLQILDLSYNSLGYSPIKEDPVPRSPASKGRKQQEKAKRKTTLLQIAAQAWSECFKENKSLLHVDLSHNGMPWDGFLSVIAEGLKENNTCLGLHMRGNEALVDAWGFLQPVKEFGFLAADHLPVPKAAVKPKPSQKGQLPIEEPLLKGARDLSEGISSTPEACENCWICGRWTEVEFLYTPGISDGRVDLKKGEKHDPTEPIHLHIDCDSYTYDLLLPMEEELDAPRKYRSIRMVPPGDQLYYFSIGDDDYVAQDHSRRLVRTLNEVLEMQNNAASEEEVKKQKPISLASGSQKMELLAKVSSLKEANIIRQVPPTQFFFRPDEIARMKVKPRMQKSLDDVGNVKEWNVAVSVFRDFRVDDDNHLNRCFEADWECIAAKVEYLVKDPVEREELEQLLKRNYEPILSAYKYQAGIDLQSNQPSISKEGLSQILQACGTLVDGRTIDAKDIGIARTAVKWDSRSNNKLIPGERLIRYNFLEAMIRIADHKFIRSKYVQSAAKTVLEAVQWLIEDFTNPNYGPLNANIWRQKVLWQEDCDLAVKQQFATVQKCFVKCCAHSGRNKRYVSPDDLCWMLTEAGVLSEYFGKVEVAPSWNLSMMTQVDELTQSRHHQMHFAEFIEALCRIADKLIIPNLLTEDYNTIEEFWQDDPDISKYRQRPLKDKIEAFLYILARNFLGNVGHLLSVKMKLKFFKTNNTKAANIEVDMNPWRKA